MKRLLMALAMTSILSLSVSAGDMHTGDSPAPAPGGTPQGISSPSPTASAPGDTDAAQPVFEDALSALLSVLGLVV